jgi:hypothetical protein
MSTTHSQIHKLYLSQQNGLEWLSSASDSQELQFAAAALPDP